MIRGLFFLLATGLILGSCTFRGKLTGDAVVRVPSEEFLSKGNGREFFYDFHDEMLAAFYPGGILKVWTPKVRYVVTNSFLRRTERIQFRKSDELLLINWNPETKSVELFGFHLQKKTFRELPKWRFSGAVNQTPALKNGDSNSVPAEPPPPLFPETPSIETAFSERSSTVILVGNSDILILEKNADKNGRLIHHSIPAEIPGFTNGGVTFQRVRLSEEEGLCTLVYFQGGKRGIERALLKRFDYTKGAVKVESWFDTDPSFFFDMAEDDVCAFTSFSKDQTSLLFDFHSLANRGIRSRKVFHLEHTDMPLDFHYNRGKLTGYLLEGSNISFYRWN